MGIGGPELLVLLVVALVLVGPERLPHYAERLGRWARDARAFVRTARQRVTDETGMDWEELDPRRYDPRRIVREALLDEDDPQPAKPASPGPRAVAGGPAPFDDEAT
ncbi:twin-arginine translocase TatA/TatE family subunit [Actinotalea sp. M2MS4P-6]|uniref:twin-arginine translocase TatA/TatE family subunit n=1 Tax=Actinotalea sp. M2MS4P-6 TaxID=2983762 RepID=UPI0021E37238|nr:twin-arginine translocase TatA/TatE family subunit [Actinotalea sp. M2MS4P-6]MCV2393480.1 twin-arginine translocase TatA/TatE family subunit [Actinotalea sp. M2MS4P-6]